MSENTVNNMLVIKARDNPDKYTAAVEDLNVNIEHSLEPLFQVRPDTLKGLPVNAWLRSGTPCCRLRAR